MATRFVLDEPAMDALLDTEDGGAVGQSAITISDLAEHVGDLTPFMTGEQLATLGADVVRDYDRDLSDRGEWERIVEEGLKRAAQEEREAKDYPWRHASNVNFPILTVAAQQFNARSYPAICKSGEIVQVKVIGSDKGRPQMMQTPQGIVPVPQMAVNPQTGVSEPVMGQDGKPAVVWAVPPGAKTARAQRVRDYLNVYFEYRMEDWEADTDLMLYQIPIIGCGFRKQWVKNGKVESAYVSALDLVVPPSTRNLDTAPRYAERIPDVYPYQIRQRMASGEYRSVDLPAIGEDAEAPRLLLEAHRLIDMDGDGLEEPYIVTVDKETSEVLKVEANFGPEDVTADAEGAVIDIAKGRFYIKYEFLPHPKGLFYSIGFAHLLDQMGDIINTTINQMFDAGHAQIAGGGFIASGLRLQGNNQSNRMYWEPGEYKTVNMAGGALREAIVERTFPQPSPIMFNLLELMLGAAHDVASIKDVTSGDASNNGQVGTTLALIEQGLQVFTAIHKRVYRSLKDEFSLLYRNLGRYGGEGTARDYQDVLDDPAADFQADFNEADMDVRPVADPTSVTRIQKMARAQALLQMRGQGLNDIEINKRALEAMDVEDIDKLLPPENAPPPPQIVAELAKTNSETEKNEAQAEYYRAQASKRGLEAGLRIGEAEAYGQGAGDGGRVRDMGGIAGDEMGDGGGEPGGFPPAAGMEPGLMGAGAGEPASAV